jgi:hypothetical protein
MDQYSWAQSCLFWVSQFFSLCWVLLFWILLCWVSFIVSVSIQSIMLSIVMLNVAIQCSILGVISLNVIVLRVAYAPCRLYRVSLCWMSRCRWESTERVRAKTKLGRFVAWPSFMLDIQTLPSRLESLIFLSFYKTAYCLWFINHQLNELSPCLVQFYKTFLCKLQVWDRIQNTIFLVTYERAQAATVFIPGRLF